MTYCSAIGKPLLKKIKEGKSLDEVGSELCGDSVRNPRKKAIRLIKELLGEKTLVEYASTLKYDTEMADLSKKRKTSSQRKIVAKDTSEGAPACTPGGGQEVPVRADIHKVVRDLVNQFGYDTVCQVLEALRQEAPNINNQEMPKS